MLKRFLREPDLKPTEKIALATCYNENILKSKFIEYKNVLIPIESFAPLEVGFANIGYAYFLNSYIWIKISGCGNFYKIMKG